MQSASLIGLICLLAGCSRPAGRADAPGTYVLHNAPVSDTLWVRPDGGYVHVIRRNDAEPVVSRGPWEFEELGASPSVVFADFPSRTTMELPPEQWRRGYWPALLRRTRTGAVILPVDLDGRAQYHRISTRLLGSGASQ